ncbi:M23 family metallopeptidase [Methylopila sp. M107]|uniref:M23 family metallopeptidase n=1 Tax=Methylopila sp. M107 TaxID=1101190 RepID=UPI0003773A40|nr:M23 family metallopeptidase [Methylopila sp. M107]
MRFDDDRFGRSSDGADRIVIERGGKRTAIRLPRYGVIACFAALLGVTAWSVSAAGYMLFHDTVMAEIRQGAKASSRAYEAQISALRDELERVRTRRMVEKAGLDERLTELGLRQSLMEKRQARIAELAGAGAQDAAADEAALSFAPKPAPVDDAARALESVDREPTEERRSESGARKAEHVAASLDAAQALQDRALDGLSARNRARRATLERVYDAAGVARPALPSDGKGRGGPFEPLPAGALTFEARLDQISAERAVILAFERGLDRTPIRTPSRGASLSSGFGARTDPFLGRLAFHSGLDFDIDYGAPVKATAHGRVVSAGWSGGYGNMVEIDHGNGLSTRYGHLSSIEVAVGDELRIGATVGRVGSTGRSTGPHLHYETRVNGEAVNPLRFLNAGRLLVAKG